MNNDSKANIQLLLIMIQTLFIMVKLGIKSDDLDSIIESMDVFSEKDSPVIKKLYCSMMKQSLEILWKKSKNDKRSESILNLMKKFDEVK